MRSGHVDAVSRARVTGWAADEASPDARLELCVQVDGVEVGRVQADRPRQDLAALGRYGDGRHGFAFVFPKPLSTEADHAIAVRYADNLDPLPNGKRLLGRAAKGEAPVPFEDEATEAPNPILVTAPGRSGTTYLMSCLAACPRIVVAELVPYEVRLLSYYAAAFEVLTAPADTEKSTHPDRLEGDGFHVGFNPFNGPQHAHAFKDRALPEEFFQVWAPSRLGAAMADVVREYYRRLALDQGLGAVPFFAEKNNNLNRASRMFVRRAFATVREVVIVRDPRDVMCSHLVYFGSEQDRAFSQLSHSCRQLIALADSAGGALCVIRYEDMVRGDAAMFDRLSGFLGVPVGPVVTPAGEAMFRRHGTSASPEASMGRWRRDLSDAQQARSLRDWGGFLERFGYDRD